MTVASLALVAVVTAQFRRAAVVDEPTVALAASSAVLLRPLPGELRLARARRHAARPRGVGVRPAEHRSGNIPLATLGGVLEQMDPKEHWDHIYRANAPGEVSWYQPEARLSIELIGRVAPARSAPIIDVGGGASTLVDGLLEAGHDAVTVLDFSPAALAAARRRLGARAARVRWVVADVLDVPLSAAAYTVWHDRAVFHFLTEPADRARYVAETRRAVRPGGHVIVASFAPEGPARCSGLEVARYTPEEMHAEFGAGFRLLDSVREDHRTPGGALQAFVYCLCRVEARRER